LALRATPRSRTKAQHLRGGNGEIEIVRRRDKRGYTYDTLDFLYKINAGRPGKGLSGDLFEATMAVISIPAEFLRHRIPAVTGRSVIGLGLVESICSSPVMAATTIRSPVKSKSRRDLFSHQ
jgi:hypothetical protein